MKSNTTFIFAGIMSAIVGNAYATGENIVTSKSYVDSVFQTKIPATVTDDYLGLTRSLVATTDTSGQVEQIGLYAVGIMSSSDFDENTIAKRLYADYDDFLRYDSVVPSVADMQMEVEEKWDWTQIFIPQSGYQAYKDNGNWSEGQIQDWLLNNVKGTGLVTKTSTDGVVGERKIFEASDVSGYHAQGLTQNQKDIQDISIPTVGAMMSAISSGATAALPTGTSGTVVTYNGATNGVQQFTETAIASSATHNPQTGALTNGSDIANVTLVETEIATRETKMTCAGWPDGVEHTDANCWLWQKN